MLHGKALHDLSAGRRNVKFFTLDFRFLKYASRERKSGRVPFIDPFATNPCRQVYGKF